MLKVKKVKFTLEQAMKAHAREQRYNSTLSLTSALDGGDWLMPCPGRFTHGKDTRYPLYKRPGGPQGRSGRVRKTSIPPGFHPWTVHPLASRYTDYSIPAHRIWQDIRIGLKNRLEGHGLD